MSDNPEYLLHLYSESIPSTAGEESVYSRELGPLPTSAANRQHRAQRQLIFANMGTERILYYWRGYGKYFGGSMAAEKGGARVSLGVI